MSGFVYAVCLLLHTIASANLRELERRTAGRGVQKDVVGLVCPDQVHHRVEPRSVQEVDHRQLLDFEVEVGRGRPAEDGRPPLEHNGDERRGECGGSVILGGVEQGPATRGSLGHVLPRYRKQATLYSMQLK